ncbi:MAG: glycosyl hydrolase, partial [Gemmatimonadetes bacterium]
MTLTQLRNTVIALIVAVGNSAAAQAGVQTSVPARKIDSLLSRMTLEEKLGQLNLLSFDDRSTPAQLDLVRRGLVGGFLNLTGATATREAQHVAVTESRLRIPLLLGYDVIHGYRTTFPIPLAEASTWDPAAAQAAAHVAAVEAAAAGVNWTFAPMVDIARDPRWGRIAEGSGEDPYLGSVMAAAWVHGFQGADLRASDAVLATPKHFAAYGGAEGGRDYNTVDVSERTLRETYLPPFRAAVDAGAGSIMTSFNEIAGLPSTANRWLVTTLLRGEWKLRGMVVSDWTSIDELRAHGVAGSRAEAGRLALEAGVDMDMVSRIYLDDLPAFVRAGRIPVATVDAAVRRVLQAKVALGLFDDPYHGATVERERATSLAPQHRELARRVAREAIVLLKNDTNLLPLDTTRHTLAVIGPLADDKVAVLGP